MPGDYRVDCYGDCNYEAPVRDLLVDAEGDVVLHDGTWKGDDRAARMESLDERYERVLGVLLLDHGEGMHRPEFINLAGTSLARIQCPACRDEAGQELSDLAQRLLTEWRERARLLTEGPEEAR